jgi:hypothetical protein
MARAIVEVPPRMRTVAIVISAGAHDREPARERRRQDAVGIDLGEQTTAFIVGNVCVWHVAEHNGEIAALKGAQGLKGLPF